MWDSSTSTSITHVDAGEYDRPTATPHQSRSVVLATEGMVATSQPLAAGIGIDILKQGGNAVDAAIAVNAALGVVEPMSCGIGGDLFVIYWEAKTRKLYGLNASGRSPYDLNRKLFEELGLKNIPIEGPLSWSVPGCVDGWETLRKRFGTRELKELLAPSIHYAEKGFPVTEVIATYWELSREALSKHPNSRKTFLPHGVPPKEGELFRNPRLANTYRTIAKEGSTSFYHGEIAREIVKFSKEQGGFFQMKDFEDHTSSWVEPVSINYRGFQIWELPPNGQGIAALQMLNILKQYDLQKYGPKSADYLHLFVEAKKLAFADRAKFYADPDFRTLPVKELISNDYAKRQQERINMQKAAVNVPAGCPQLREGDTVYLTVIDKDRNCCSMIQSIYYGFGSKMTAGDLGFPLQNRGALFSLQEDHYNRLDPHKRPFHTIIPAFVTKDNKPYFCFGVMGGDMQPQGHVQVLVNLIDFGMNVQMAGDAARIRHAGSATPTGLPMSANGGEVAVESGIPTETIEELKRRGHHVIRAPGSFGGYQGIRIDLKNGVLQGGTESRKDGVAVGY